MDPRTGYAAYPEDMNAVGCSETDVQEFTDACIKMGVTYLGLCCGNYGSLTRRMATTLGRSPPASKYLPDRQTLKKNISRWFDLSSSKGLPPRLGHIYDSEKYITK